MEFKAEGPWNTDKYCRPPWLADQKDFRILEALEWLKQQHFDLGDSILIVSALKALLFSLFSQLQVSRIFCIYLTIVKKTQET